MKLNITLFPFLAALALTAGCDGRPDGPTEQVRQTPVIPGHRHQLVSMEETFSSCDNTDFVYFDRSERLDWHPDASNRLVFSHPDDQVALFNISVLDDDNDGWWQPNGNRPPSPAYIAEDGTLDHLVDMTILMDFRLSDVKPVVLEAEFHFECGREVTCEPYVSGGALECTMGRRYVWEYTEDIDDYFPLYDYWVEE